MKIFYIIVLFVGLDIRPGWTCPTPIFNSLSVQDNFDLKRFLGLWYEIEWLPAEPHSEAEIWRDFYQQFDFENGSTTRLSVPGKARVLNQSSCFSFGPWTIVANNSAKMILERRGSKDTPLLNWPYHVLKTDYSNYALIYGCTSGNFTPTDPCPEPILWLFGRTVSLANEHRSMLSTFIENTLCVNRSRLEITPHSDQPCYRSSAFRFTVSSYALTLIFVYLFYRVH